MRPAAPPSPPLIINDGCLGGLVACWSALIGRRSASVDPDSPLPAMLVPRSAAHPPDSPARARSLQAELCRMDVVPAPIDFRLDTLPGIPASQLLLSAAQIAISLGLHVIIWPAHAGPEDADGEPDLDRVAEIRDRAALVTYLASLDQPANPAAPLHIQTPYADLTDRRLMELAVDMDVPLWSAWWCQADEPGDGGPQCGRCEPCLRMAAAIHAAAPGFADRLLRSPVSTRPAAISQSIAPHAASHPS